MILSWFWKRSHQSSKPKAVAHLQLEELEDRCVPDANPLMQWSDQGIVYAAPSGAAYYPSVTYNAAGFGIGAPYRMWYSDGTNGYVTNSSDGVNWGAPTIMSGLSSNASHIQVVYDPGNFGGNYAYKAWFWDTVGPYPGIHIDFAESNDGVHWTAAQTITQNPAQPLVTGVSPDWNEGSYGPINIHYQPAASNTGSDPWNYRYVMYYDGTNGNNEYTGLAYSTDGLYWSAYPTGTPGNPVLQGQPNSWDSVSTAYGTVIQESPTSYVYFYSGGNGSTAYGSAVSQGIGLATSGDGLTWTKDPGNPIFNISQGVSYRNQRDYTPDVILGGDGVLRMYYSAVGNSGVKDIGLAIIPAPPPPPPPPVPATYAVADFPSVGVSLYSSVSGWKTLTASHATSLSVDANGDVVGEFPNYFGVWLYQNATATWVNLTQNDARQVAIAGDGIVVGEFPGYFGVWRYERATGWQNLTQNNASSLSVDAAGDVVGEFPGYFGVWLYKDSTGWVNLTQANASQVHLSSNGIFVGEFPQYFGVWRYESSTGWQNLTQNNAASLAVDSNGDVVGEFRGYFGVWLYSDANGWANINQGNASKVSIADDATVFGLFNEPQGIWTYQTSTGWRDITSTGWRSITNLKARLLGTIG